MVSTWVLAGSLSGALTSVLGCGAAHAGQASAPRVQFGHVFLLVEENHSYSEIIGSSAMPYLNSLASNYGLATQYYANFHPSISDYFMLTTGQPISFDDAYAGTVNADNLVRELDAAGKTWKSYAESLPQPGYVGGDVYPYMKHHNPFVYLSEVIQQPNQAANVVPFTEFSSDRVSGHLPNFAFIIPNILDDAHTGTLDQADTWLVRNIAPLINSATFQQDGLLLITFDEGDLNDLSYGGGRVATVVISGKGKKKFQSTNLYQHQSTLRLTLEALGVSSFPGAAAVAPGMDEFFP
ncbi:MAG: hypothetical protein JOZ36_17910 [Acidobacteria bacterium]|nr:hypothetical protein [Acidobacteriota bacterium]